MATVSKICKTAAYDKELWYPQFQSAWSPEYCVIPAFATLLLAVGNYQGSSIVSDRDAQA
jgi:hypothetical protein